MTLLGKHLRSYVNTEQLESEVENDMYTSYIDWVAWHDAETTGQPIEEQDLDY